MVVCLKMLFRRSTRKRFVCLVIVFLCMMAFNTFSYVLKFHKTEQQKGDVLEEKAFKVFFLRSRTKNASLRFISLHQEKLQEHGSVIVKKAFIYQNNLYINLFTPSQSRQNNEGEERGALNLLYGLFNFSNASQNFYLGGPKSGENVKIRNIYFDHNGAGLGEDIIAERHKRLKQDLTDIADMIREVIRGRRIDVFNSIKETIFHDIRRIPLNKGYKLNPYLSRVESIVPMNFLHILMNIRYDNTTDVMDLAESVKYGEDVTIETDSSFLHMPSVYTDKVMYGDIDIFPRYFPLYVPEILKTKWNWLLYQNVDLRMDFLDYIDQLHFKGYYMFSYEKSNILKEFVKKINDDIRSNHMHFYLTDLSMGIVFPFMISLFAFIHLKTEIAFLLMFKNRIRELLFIFWLIPVFLMFFVKGGILASYILFLMGKGPGLSGYIVFPLSLTFLCASMVFYPINRWCFCQFTGDSLNLYAIHKGR